ncbi:SLC13 family permease [Halobacteriales archaeon Cl-PHB]
MALSTGALVVFGLVALALVLFVTEWLPPDITAIGVLVSLATLEPLTGVPTEDALRGFASPAVVTIIAMYILSHGVQETGVVDWLGAKLARATDGDSGRLLGTTLGSTGVAAGLVNNTPVVAVLIPMVSDLAGDQGVSPSKFLLPLSFAAMLGGTLTLVGSSINLLASEVSATLLDHPIGMFEFTALGALVLVVGLAYLLTVGYRLTPARVAPTTDFTAEYELERHLAQVKVRKDSPVVGQTPTDLFVGTGLALDVDVLQFSRESATTEGSPGETLRTETVTETYAAGQDREFAAGDVLTVRGNRQAINRFASEFDLQQRPRAEVRLEAVGAADHPGMLAEVVLPPDSGLRGATAAEEDLLGRFDTTVIAVRRGDDVIRDGLDDLAFSAGDTLLLQTTESAVAHLQDEGDAILTDTLGEPADLDRPRRPVPDLDYRAPVSVAILVAAVFLAAFTSLAIPVTALGGVVAMVVAGCLRPADAYDAVSWNVVFLLAGVLPLGVALQRTGGAAVIGETLAGVAGGLPPVAALGLVYLFASLLAAVVTPVATVVLLTPVAIDLGTAMGADPFAFVLASLFGASAAYLTPIGYQTNLMVYGPGGYRFTDFTKVGLPLLALLTLVVPAGIALLHGV